MSVKKLKEWLKQEDSTGSGWPKDDGSGETIGHGSYVSHLAALIFNPANVKQVGVKSSKPSRTSRKIQRNMIKVSDINSGRREAEIEYLDDIDHMRKVVSYCKRHLAWEEKAEQDTDSKSYKSLKNWGHNAQKT
jgi:hypothetical protein